jgi:hypothetical protein
LFGLSSFELARRILVRDAAAGIALGPELASQRFKSPSRRVPSPADSQN